MSTTIKKCSKLNEKKSRTDKSDLGQNFIAPDGGWGWLVCLAAGISNLCISPTFQNFGIIFRDKLMDIGLTNSEITAIFNTHQAVSSCTGLLNGSIFRKFTYRQIAIIAGILIGTGLYSSSFANSFFTYILTYSIMFGFGFGISTSSTSLALNTYFKEKRRRAASFAWTVTGLGPIIMPYVTNIFLNFYGIQGTIWIFSAISLHTLVSAMIYQPVKWHTKKKQEQNITENACKMCLYCQQVNGKKNSPLFSSQYLYTEDDINNPGYEIVPHGIPMLSKANDGWYGSKNSLTPCRQSEPKLTNYSVNGSNLAINCRNKLQKSTNLIRPNNFNREKELSRSIINLNSNFVDSKCTCSSTNLAEETKLIKQLTISEEKTGISLKIDEKLNYNNELKFTWTEKIIIFFDLDLLKDFTYVNLMLGITLSTFADMNFSVLTPFFLNDYGFTKNQIALIMSIIDGTDITIRFLIPFIAERINWDNRVFFLIGISLMVIGRIFLTQIPSYEITILLFTLMGIGKGLRTIFMNLIIPSHVPLNRLPAASGLQLLIAGIFTLIFGPIVGIIRDNTNYPITLNFLNLMSLITILSWTIELIYGSCKKYQKEIKIIIEDLS